MGFGFFLFVSAVVWTAIIVMLFVFFASRAFPTFFRFKVKRFLDGAICVFGFLSPLTLAVVWAATHDIFNDYVSSSNYRQTYPSWVDSYHSCHGEWNALAISFLLIIVFHLLLLARRLVNWANQQHV